MSQWGRSRLQIQVQRRLTISISQSRASGVLETPEARWIVTHGGLELEFLDLMERTRG